MYSVTAEDTVTLLDTLDMEGYGREFCVDRQSGQVYISSDASGVHLVRYDGSKLVPLTTLKCVRKAVSLAMVTSDNLYVCDWVTKTVCRVDVTQDRVTARLQTPPEVANELPSQIAVLGDTVLVVYVDLSLVIYHHSVHTPGELLARPQGLKSVFGLTTDHHFTFLLCDGSSRSVSVLDVSGNLTHTISVPGYKQPRYCTMVRDQLWVGCDNGDIVVMSTAQ